MLLLANTVPWLRLGLLMLTQLYVNCFPENYWENPSCLWELRKVLAGTVRQKSSDSFRVALADASNVIWFISLYGLDLTLAKVEE